MSDQCRTIDAAAGLMTMSYQIAVGVEGLPLPCPLGEANQARGARARARLLWQLRLGRRPVRLVGTLAATLARAAAGMQSRTREVNTPNT